MLYACDSLEQVITETMERIAPDGQDSFLELVYFPAAASLNVLRMQIYAGINGMYLTQGNPLADIYAGKVACCIDRDKELTELYHSCANGKWNHMMSSKHVGFVNWNDEGSGYPEVYTLEEWQALSEKPESVLWECETALEEEHLILRMSDITSEMPDWMEEMLPPGTYASEDDCICIEASGYADKSAGIDGAEWNTLECSGRTTTCEKVLPNLTTYAPDGSGPTLTYLVAVPESAAYELRLYLAPSNSPKIGGKMRYSVQVGD